MPTEHLTPIDLESYIDNQLDPAHRATLDEHFVACDTCRTRVTQSQKFNSALRGLPRENPPPDLAALIVTAAEWHTKQEEQRQARMPLVAGATLFSLLLAFWFGFEAVIAIQENSVVDFWTLFTTHAELSYSSEAFFAFVEAFPLGETLLMLFAIFTSIGLGQNLIESIRPRAVGLS